LKIAIYQNDPAFGEIQNNIDDILRVVENEEYDLLVLPELAVSGYQFKNREEALNLADIAGNGLTFDRFSELARRKNCSIVYGYPEKKNNELFNSALAILPDGCFHNYQKTHLFNTEWDIFSPGETGFVTYKFKDVTFGIMICYDWRYPESARRLALDGAQVICHPSNLVLPFCPDAMVTRALENNVYTVTANRVGGERRTEPAVNFIGKSRIISPNGDILADLPEDITDFDSVIIDPEIAKDKQVTPRNDLFKDRRTDFY